MTESDKETDLGREGVPITREILASGVNLAALRALSFPGITVRSDAEIDASLDETLAAYPPDTDAWVFGYGSLMWNPAIHFIEQRLGTLNGFHRKFCLKLFFGRASPERPGLMLALDEGGLCQGMLFRIAADAVREELRLVWRREMATGSYIARWVDVETAAGSARAITFVANHQHSRYVSGLSELEIAAALAHASGHLGSCASYLGQTVEALRKLGVRDEAMERIALAMAVEQAKPAKAAE